MTTETKERHAVDEYKVAAALGLSVHAIRADRYGSRRIPFYRLGTSIRYDMERVWQALAEHEIGGPARRAAGRRG